MTGTVHPFDDAVLDRQVELAAEDPETARTSGVFEVDTLDRANRVVWRIGRLRAQLAEDEALYRSERERLDDWIGDARRRVGGQIEFLEGLAEVYHRRLLGEDRRRKTVKLPAGELQARKARDHWEINDAELIAWAEAHDFPALVNRPAPKVNRNAVKKHLAHMPADGEDVHYAVTDDGEVVPGVVVHVASDDDLTFSVQTPEVDR